MCSVIVLSHFIGKQPLQIIVLVAWMGSHRDTHPFCTCSHCWRWMGYTAAASNLLCPDDQLQVLCMWCHFFVNNPDMAHKSEAKNSSRNVKLPWAAQQLSWLWPFVPWGQSKAFPEDYQHHCPRTHVCRGDAKQQAYIEQVFKSGKTADLWIYLLVKCSDPFNNEPARKSPLRCWGNDL